MFPRPPPTESERTALRTYLQPEAGCRALCMEALVGDAWGWDAERADYIAPDGRRFPTLDTAVEHYRERTGKE